MLNSASNQNICANDNADIEDSNDDRLLVELPSNRNTDKTLYLCSQQAKTCPLCKRFYRFMVPHFKAQHPNDEVYVSRISPKMVEYIAPQNAHERTFARYSKNHSAHLTCMCIFCEEMKSFSSHYYVDHMRSHTGEYNNLCIVCNHMCSSSNHCGLSTEKFDHFNLRHEDMRAYRCKLCNFVQINMENMDAHLEKHHGLFEAVDANTEIIVLLPALNTVIKQINPDEAPTQGE